LYSVEGIIRTGETWKQFDFEREWQSWNWRRSLLIMNNIL